MKTHKFFALLCMLTACVAAVAGDNLNISVTVPGTLRDRVVDADTDMIETLTVEGLLNAADLEYLGTASGLIGTVKTLDLSKVNFELDGSIYRKVSVPTGSMGVNNIDHFALWPRDSVSSYYTLAGTVCVHWGNDLGGAFIGSKFERVVLPESIYALGQDAFSQSANLREVVFNGHEQYIGAEAFFEAGNLSEVSIPPSVEYIGGQAFAKTGNLRLDLSHVTTLYSGCFSGSAISAVTLSPQLTGLAESLFDGCTKLTSISLPPLIKVVPKYCFSNCSALTDVKLNAGLENIAERAFLNCPFAEITLPESVKVIERDAFAGCANLASVNCPPALEQLGRDPFKGTKVVKSFEVENGISYFGTAAYLAQDFMPSHVTFRGGTTLLADGIFDTPVMNGNRSEWAYNIVESVELPSSIRHIGAKAFRYTKITAITLPEGLETIGDYAFCEIPLKSITFPSTLRKIGRSAFSSDGNGAYNCLLTSVNLPEGLEEIGIEAFSCQPLVSVTLPESLKVLGERAFGNNDNLVRITYNCRDAHTEAEAIYSPFYGSSCDRITFGPNVESIPDMLFCFRWENKFNVRKVDLPEGLKSIGADAFYFTSLEEVTLPSTLESIGDRAFKETKLTTVALPQSLKNIGVETFYRAPLTGLTLPAAVSYIGDNAFGEITTFDKVEFNCVNAQTDHYFFINRFGSNEEFFGQPFYKAQIGSLIIGEGVEQIMPYCFYEATGFSNVSVPVGCELGERAFYKNSDLTAVSLPEGLKSLPDAVFYHCYNLKTINIPSTVEHIGNFALWSCLNVTGLTLPVMLREVGELAFYKVPFGSEINLGPCVERVGDKAFSNNYNVRRIFIPSQIKSIGELAFDVSPDYNTAVEVISMVENPADVETSSNGIFSNNSSWRLRTPYGTQSAYKTSPVWRGFGDYQTDGNIDIDCSNGFEANFKGLADRDLNGTIVDGVYYSLERMDYADDGGVMPWRAGTKIEDPALLDILTPFNYDLTLIFKGMAVKLPAGSGRIEIDAEPQSYSYIVKIAGQEPVRFDNSDRQLNVVKFDLPEETYAYIYSDIKVNRTKIYSLAIKSTSGSVEATPVGECEAAVVARYHLDGRPAADGATGLLIERLSDGTARKVVRAL